jgi:hypothetical protein
MEYSITPDEQAKYITLKIKGRIDRQAMLERIVETSEVAAKRGLDRFLADFTEAQNAGSIADDYELINVDTRTNPSINPYSRIALLVAPEEYSYDFFEIASQNAGWNLRLFRDRQEALKFLGVLNPESD